MWNTVIQRLREFRRVRDWGRHHTAHNLATAIAVEAGELQELFLWGATPAAQQIRDEVADVMIYCLNLCDILGFDPIAAMHDKITANERKYPIQRTEGTP
jgi:NTP pyrophosphatase (non-canonical NTP hydrolase)